MLEVGVLGEVRAHLDGRRLDLGGPRRRAVLALLVAAGGSVVPTERFVEELWAGAPPPRAVALQAYVSHLRRVLEPDRGPRRPATVLVSAAPGYRLDLPVEAVDAWHHVALVAAARRALADGDPVTALAELDRARARWRARPTPPPRTSPGPSPR
ncbi:MAG TPA: winged helix-turn-helix domain-containing protein, partial [Actinomycetospora sp.]|nr:winged helix-turn-helix domain-containing protein [Actinomycetospora sp.]